MKLQEISSLEAKIKIVEDNLREILAPKDKYPSDFDILNSIKGIELGTIATFICMYWLYEPVFKLKKSLSPISCFIQGYLSQKNTKRKTPHWLMPDQKRLDI